MTMDPSPERRFRIYLAGPISGCNESQRRAWRNTVRKGWGERFDFEDPADDYLPRSREDEKYDEYDDYEIVVRDQQSIARSDAVLANMWKESIGTSLGVFQACVQGKPVVVVDPNCLENRILRHHVRGAVETTLDRAMHRLHKLLQQQYAIVAVEKSNGRTEPFSRAKLTLSIRHACLAAGRNDMLAAAEIVPATLNELHALVQGRGGDTVRSEDVKDAVWSVLQRCEADPLREDEYSGIRMAWESFRRRRNQAKQPQPAAVKVHAKPREIDVRADKSHTTIWGVNVHSIHDLPAGPRKLFEQLSRVDGIHRVSLHAMQQGAKVDHCAVEILASKTPGNIEGKCHDNGKKGRTQCFRIVLATKDPVETEEVRITLVRHLKDHNLLYRSHRAMHRENAGS